MNKKEYLKIINKYHKIYNQKYQILYYKYYNVLKNNDITNMPYVMNEHKIIMVDIIKEILNYFHEFKKINTMIILTGSLARNTNLLYSDIDINFIYDDKFKKEYIFLEEKIMYMLSKIFNYRGRDQIHGITYYLPIISNDFINEINNNQFKMIFDDGVITYKCRDNNTKTSYNTFNSSRDPKVLSNYLITNLDKVKDWTNCYEYLDGKKEYDKFHHLIKEKEKEIKVDYIKIIKEIKENIKDNKELKEDLLVVRDIKLYEKVSELNIFYRYLALIYKIANNRNIKLDKFDILLFQKNKVLEKLNLNNNIFNDFYLFLILITKLQFILYEINLDLSKHCYIEVKRKDINNLNKKLFDDKFDIIEEIEDVKNKINKMILNDLEVIEKSYE